ACIDALPPVPGRVDLGVGGDSYHRRVIGSAHRQGADVRARLRGARSWRGADVRATVHSPVWPPTADVRAVAVAAGTNLGGGARAPPGRCRVRRSVLVQDPLGLV